MNLRVGLLILFNKIIGMQKELIEKNPLLKLSFEFSLLILQYCDLLDQQRKYAISKQLIRSGTSIGASRERSRRNTILDHIM